MMAVQVDLPLVEATGERRQRRAVWLRPGFDGCQQTTPLLRRVICLEATLGWSRAAGRRLWVLLALGRRHLPDDEPAVLDLAANLLEPLGALLFLASLLGAWHQVNRPSGECSR
jgi:hypothetical protein